MTESSEAILLRALDLVDTALLAVSDDAAIEEVRADLRVLDRETLERTATALAVFVPRRGLPPNQHHKLRQRLEIWALEIGVRS